MLSGEGADENLAGYQIYQRMLRYRPLGWLPSLGPLAGLAPSHRLGQAAEWIGRSIPERYRGVSAVFTAAERKRLLGRGAPAIDAAAAHYERARTSRRSSEMLYYDQKVWLPTTCSEADKMTMAASLELRVPFLDHKVVEWAWRVPQSQKITGGVGKALLRRAFADLVPPAILARDKVGFTVGGGDRFAEDVGREARRMLVDERALEGLVDGAEVNRLVRRHQQRDERLIEPCWPARARVVSRTFLS